MNRKMPFTRRIASYKPGWDGLAHEVLSCGHRGHHSQIPLIEHRMREGRGRVCALCAKQQRALEAEVTCHTKRAYASKAQALEVARHERQQVYRCRVCRGFHLARPDGA
jgi:hypothetical protein